MEETKPQEKGDDILRRMLKSPPEPNIKPGESDKSLKKKPGGNPAKNDRPEDRD